MTKPYVEQFYEALKTGNTDKAIFLTHFMKDNINEIYKYKTPLYWAKKFNNEKVIEVLEKKGAIDGGVNDELIVQLEEHMMFSAKNNVVEGIKVALISGVDVNYQDENGYTSLMWASKLGCYDVVDKLLMEGANPDIKANKGETALTLAIEFNKDNTRVIEKLILANADVNAIGLDDKRPLCIAAENTNEKITALLVQKGADVNLKDKAGNTPLIYALNNWNNTSDFHNVVDILVNAGALVNEKNSKGVTPLMLACYHGYYEEAVKLIKAKALVNEVDNGYTLYGTALKAASVFGKTEIINLLIQNGGVVDLKDRFGSTPLMQASRNGKFKAVVMLIEAGADINAQNCRGYTPLMEASESGQIDVIKELIRKGADVNIKNNEGKSAISLASNIRTRIAIMSAVKEKNKKESIDNNPSFWGRIKDII